MREYIAISWKVRLIQAHPALIEEIRQESEILRVRTWIYFEE